MTKSFRTYLKESTREYHLRIKTVVPLDDERMEAVERLLSKYRLLDIDQPQRTILQDHPLDFPDIDNAEVWILDIVTGVPVAAYVLQQELVMSLKIPEKYVVVRGDNDPLEIEGERIRAMKAIADEAKGKGLTPAGLMGTDPEYRPHEQTPDGGQFFGNGYNSQFLKHLSQVAATRRDAEVKPADPLFDFLGLKDERGDAGDFNAAIPDAPASEPWWLADHKAKGGSPQSPEGNYDDDFQSFGGTFKDKAGKQIDITATTRSVRQGAAAKPKGKGKTK